MKGNGRKRLSMDEQIERFCQGASTLLQKIHERTGEEELKRERKRKKREVFATSE